MLAQDMRTHFNMSEKSFHTAIATYIKAQYPKAVFTSESSGVRVSIGVAKMLKGQRSVHKLPDLIVLEPKGGYHGLVIELKEETPYKRDGSLKKGRGIDQAATLRLLQDKNYYACFGVGFEQTKNIIDSYMKL